MTELEDLTRQISALRTRRAIVLADLAVESVRQVCPEAALVLFEGAQEPGGTATILRLVASDGSVLYDLKGTAEGDGFDDTDLSPAQDDLTSALEDDEEIFARGLGGNYIVSIPRE
jgi:hypothetical protein